MVYEIILGREEKDRLLFGTEGTVLLGKHYVNMGSVTALSQPVYLDLNKSHVVFICGKRGSGKCLTGDTLITLSNGRQVPIREIEYTSEQVLALNHELKIQPQGHTDFYKRIVDHLLAIKLRSGKVIKLTPEHPLLTLEGWKPAKELAINSRIATPRLINAFGNAPLSEAEVKILAYMIAEGHTKAPLFFTNSDPEIVQDLSSALKTFYSVLELTPLGKYGYKVNSRNEKRTVISHHSVRDNKGRFTQGSWIKTEKRIMRQFLETHGVYGLLSSEKEIPSGILQAPKQKIALFLNRIFSCDGSIYFSKSWQISYSTSSLKLAQGVHHLLLRFGILSKIRTTEQFLPDGRPYTAREIVICGENVIRFFNEIGFFGRKEKKQAIALIQSANLLRNPNNDTIPQEIWKFYKPQSWAEPGRHWGYVHPKAARESVDYAPSRQKLLSIAEFEQSERLKLLATSDIFWDEIEKVEHLYGEFDVYDITVPNLHNFIANDIIVHNSYALGAIAEGITQLPEEYRKKLSVIMFDTMGIYWTMKYPNHRDELLLKEWGLEGKGVPINIYVPFGHFDKWKEDGIPVDKPFALNPSELAPDDWNLVFEISTNDPIAVFIERVILELRETRTNYSIGSILAAIDRDGQEDPFVRQAAKNRFSVAQTWGLFSSDATPVKDLAESGQVAVLDLSAYSLMPNGWRIKHLVMGIICMKLFIERMKARKQEEHESVNAALHYFGDETPVEQMPLCWIMIDEAHEFLPNSGKTASSDALITLLREGRQPGIALVLATQQPGKIHTDAMTQSDIILAHRLTAKIDTDALGSLLQSYLRTGLDKELANLPRVPGACIAVDDVNERMAAMRIRPRFSWHGGGAPGVLPEKKKEVFEF